MVVVVAVAVQVLREIGQTLIDPRVLVEVVVAAVSRQKTTSCAPGCSGSKLVI
jgi:hypothetical protein